MVLRTPHPCLHAGYICRSRTARLLSRPRVFKFEVSLRHIFALRPRCSFRPLCVITAAPLPPSDHGHTVQNCADHEEKSAGLVGCVTTRRQDAWGPALAGRRSVDPRVGEIERSHRRRTRAGQPAPENEEDENQCNVYRIISTAFPFQHFPGEREFRGVA